VKLHLDGKTEEAKVPSSWLNEWANPKDQKFEIVARRIDVGGDGERARGLRLLGRRRLSA
jgi:hypothetical protein